MSAPRVGRLHVITDTTLQSRYTHEDLARFACAGGADVVQLRDKLLPDDAFLTVARRVKAICDDHGVTLIINDRVEIAHACGTGVHVGRDDMAVAEARRVLGPDACIGTSTASAAEVRKAYAEGASYAGFGHVFATGSKEKAGAPLGLDALREAAKGAPIPLIAIGGVTLASAGACIQAGAWGVAVIGAVVLADDPETATRALRAAIHGT